MVRVLGIVLVIAAAGFLFAPAKASLYQPDEPMAVPVRPDGVGEPLPFDEFKRRFVTLTNQLNPTLKDPEGKPTDRDKLMARVKERRGKRDAAPDEIAAFAADLLRLGNTDEAVNLLKPLYDERTRRGTRTYFVLAALIHSHAQRGEWDHALGYMPDLFDAALPEKVTGWTDAQRDWFKKLDRDVLPQYLFIRKAEAELGPRATPETEEPTPLFPIPSPGKAGDTLRFANDAGQYEPGILAKAEHEKLPPDALAIVQQLLLWFPTDTRLYWLLAELYAVEGKIDEAQKILDEIVWSKKYSNRKVLMDHRNAMAVAVEARQQAEAKAAVEAFPISLRAIGIYFAVVVAIGVIAVLRVLRKRRR